MGPETQKETDPHYFDDCVTVAEVAEKVADPPAPKEYTRKELGQLRRRYVTVVHGTVKACGHKASFSKTKQPTSNCVECWKAYFMTSVDLEGIHVILTKQGAKELIKQKGVKYVKHFHGFLSACLLPALAAEVNNKIVEPAKIEGGSFANGATGNKELTT